MVLNIKHFKLVFNRALRVKSRDLSRALVMFNYLLTQLEQALGDSFEKSYITA